LEFLRWHLEFTPEESVPDREAFMQTICENPHDDGPRLVFADWLEEQGNCDEAELIRLQVERSRLAQSEVDERAKIKLAKREDRLRAANPQWAEEYPEIPGIIWGPIDRGFVSTVRVSNVTTLLRHAKRIFDLAPITNVWFDVLDDDGVVPLSESPWLARLTLLKAHGSHIGDQAFRRLVDSPHIAGLRRLFVTAAGIGDAGARAIARSSRLAKLNTLFLNSNRIANEGAIALAESPRLSELREVYLAGNELLDAGIAAVRRRWGDNAHV
jgi:uncharacterized protein (TIGR02996 family)